MIVDDVSRDPSLTALTMAAAAALSCPLFAPSLPLPLARQANCSPLEGGQTRPVFLC